MCHLNEFAQALNNIKYNVSMLYDVDTNKKYSGQTMIFIQKKKWVSAALRIIIIVVNARLSPQSTHDNVSSRRSVENMYVLCCTVLRIPVTCIAS